MEGALTLPKPLCASATFGFRLGRHATNQLTKSDIISSPVLQGWPAAVYPGHVRWRRDGKWRHHTRRRAGNDLVAWDPPRPNLCDRADLLVSRGCRPNHARRRSSTALPRTVSGLATRASPILADGHHAGSGFSRCPGAQGTGTRPTVQNQAAGDALIWRSKSDTVCSTQANGGGGAVNMSRMA